MPCSRQGCGGGPGRSSACSLPGTAPSPDALLRVTGAPGAVPCPPAPSEGPAPLTDPGSWAGDPPGGGSGDPSHSKQTWCPRALRPGRRFCGSPPRPGLHPRAASLCRRSAGDQRGPKVSPQSLVILALGVTVLATGATPQAQKEGWTCSGPFALRCQAPCVHSGERGWARTAHADCPPCSACPQVTDSGRGPEPAGGAGAGRSHMANLPVQDSDSHRSSQLIQVDILPGAIHPSAGRARGVAPPKLRSSFPLLAVTRRWEGRGWMWWQRVPPRKSPGSGARERAGPARRCLLGF